MEFELLAGGLHHEVQNLLAALSLNVELLEEPFEEGKVSDKVLQMLGAIKVERLRIGGVLEDFRDFASADRLNVGSLDLSELVRRQVALVKPTVEQQGDDIQWQVMNDCFRDEVVADCVRLEQVLLNLLLTVSPRQRQGSNVRRWTACREGR